MPSSPSDSLRPIPQDPALVDELVKRGLMRSPYEAQNPTKPPMRAPGQSQMPQLMPDMRQMPMPQMQPGTQPPPQMRRLDANAGPILGWDVRNPAFASYQMPDEAAARMTAIPAQPLEGGNAGALTAPTPTGPAPANPGVGSPQQPDILTLMRFMAQTGQNPMSMYNPMTMQGLQMAAAMGSPAPAVGAGVQQGAPLSPLVLQALAPMLFSGGHMRLPQGAPQGAPAPAPAPQMPMGPAPVNPNLGGGGSFQDVVQRLLQGGGQQMAGAAPAPSIDQMLQQAERGQGQRSKYMEATPIQQPAPAPAPAPAAPQGPGMLDILRQRIREAKPR